MSDKNESDGVFIRTVLAIKKIAKEINQDRFTHRDVYALGKQSAILDSRDVLWSPENVEVIMRQLADAHDTIGYDNELFSCGGETYRVIKTPHSEEEWLRRVADTEDEAGGFPTETGVAVGKLKAIEKETLKAVQAGMPGDPKHALLHCLKIAEKHTPCYDRGGILGMATHEAQTQAEKLIEQVMQLTTDLEGYHFRDRDLSAELATWKKRAEVAEGTVAEINQIVEDALASTEETPVDEQKPPFEIGTRVYCEARGNMGTVIDHCRDVGGEKVNVRFDNGTETGFYPLSSFAEPATK